MGTGVTTSLNEVYYFVSGILTSLYQVVIHCSQKSSPLPLSVIEDKKVPQGI